MPFSKISECQCKTNFDGEECKDHSQNGLASSLDTLVSATLKIPTLADIYYNVKELKDEINVGMGRLEIAIDKLTSSLEISYKRIETQLSQKFQWTNRKLSYSNTIESIQYYVKQFKVANKNNYSIRKKMLTAHVLKVGNILRWINNLNILFLGSNTIVNEHKPLMIMYMNKFRAGACSNDYKMHVDNVYRQFAVLQQEAYLMWAQALNIEETEPGIAADAYQQTLENQVNYL